jgi:hypothetical protein
VTHQPKTSHLLHTYPNARVGPIGRVRLIRQHDDQGPCFPGLAAENVNRERTARKKLAWLCSGGPAAQARSGASAAGQGAQAAALHPPGDCPDAAEGNQHPGPGDPAPGVGFEMVNVTVDAAAPLPCVAVQADEKGPTTMGLLRLAVVWVDVQGIE